MHSLGLKSLSRKSLDSARDEAGWEGEPEIRKARRPAVHAEQVAMVKLPGSRYADTRVSLKVKVNWVQTLSPLSDSRFFFGGWR